MDGPRKNEGKKRYTHNTTHYGTDHYWTFDIDAIKALGGEEAAEVWWRDSAKPTRSLLNAVVHELSAVIMW